MNYLEKVKNPEFWKAVKNDSRYAFLIESTKTYYDNAENALLPPIKFSDIQKYFNDGSRAESENYYFQRRRRLASAAILALIYPENGEYLSEIEDIIWAICDEYTWALAAHIKNVYPDDICCIDLFNSQTGFNLCEILDIYGEKLHPLVQNRVREEVKKRVINAYKSNTFFWENCDNNWAAVCACSVAGCFMYLAPEEWDKYLPRIMDTMAGYIKGFTDDGNCLEGFSYWLYGFGHYIYFADMLYYYTHGKTNLFQDPKIEKIAQFGQSNFMKGLSTISFSDCPPNSAYDIGMQHILNTKYPKLIDIMPLENTCLWSESVPFNYFIRSFMFYNPNEAGTYIPRDYYFPYAEQFVANRDKFSLAIKAGHNAVPHNHNDVGCFIFSDKDSQAICDLGAGRYTRQYFSENRYDIFCNNSFSHSVPIIDGKPQATGRGTEGSMARDGNTITIEFSKAYANQNLKNLTRRVIVKENGIILTDSFDGSIAVTERFVTKRKPEIKGNRVIIGNTALIFNSKYTVSVRLEKHFEHNVAKGITDVYCIDFENVDISEPFIIEIIAK